MAPAQILDSFKALAPSVRSAWSFKLSLLRELLASCASQILNSRTNPTLNCRAQLTKEQNDTHDHDVFTVDISGSINAPDPALDALLRIRIIDLTDGLLHAKPLHGSLGQYQAQDSPLFSYTAELGKLPERLTTITSWMPVARLYADWMVFPRRGKRKLLLNVSILARQTLQKLASANCRLFYRNTTSGYADFGHDSERTRNLAVSLAFAVSAVDDNVSDCEIKVIENWAKNNMNAPDTPSAGSRKLAKALNQAAKYFRRGNSVDPHEICLKILEIAPVADRYEILDLCLQVASADGPPQRRVLDLLKKIANWLDLDPVKFRSMAEKILPLDIHRVADMEIVLGLTPDMTKDQTRRQLRDEYRKWNARVTNANPSVRQRAAHMLRYIAQARTQHA